jgi:acetyl-CoA synthetase
VTSSDHESEGAPPAPSVAPPARVAEGAHVPSMEAYRALYRRSVEDPDGYWGEVAAGFAWERPPTVIRDCDLREGRIGWFTDGQLNVAVNCVDRHLPARAEQPAIVWEADEPGEGRTLSYAALDIEVRRAARMLRGLGVGRGDRVALYMGMVPEAAIAMLACARLGAVHSVVFGGFSAQALAGRVRDCGARVLLTQDEGRRGGRPVPLKRVADEALAELPEVEHVVVLRRTGADVPMQPGRDRWWHDEPPPNASDAPEVMGAEDPLFILYTSGSTGKPKGALHTQAGYLLYVASTARLVFDLREGDVYACVADIGWITGHSYVVYGPLANGATTVLFESTPTYPDAGRYWEMVERLGVTQLYTAPTALRQIAREGDEWVRGHDRSSLRVLGSVGEPIDPPTWRWYFDVVGEGRCSIVDTWWQTETGGILLSGLPGATPMKPGATSLPLPGVEAVVLVDGALADGPAEGELAIAASWPGQMRTLYGDHERFLDHYLRPFPGYFRTEDAVRRDEEGYFWIGGRMDDVIKVAGHRLGTAEIEGALAAHAGCAESAVVDAPEPVRGALVCAFVRPAPGAEAGEELAAALREEVATRLGRVAVPSAIRFVPALPKTRSGKVMRRILRRIAAGETGDLGDTTTLSQPESVEEARAARAY